ncbi:MAG: hypothetical protein R6U55_02135 [Desulfovermiculus sp.]
MRNALIGIGVLVLSGFIVTQALAWNGDQHRAYGPMNGGIHGQAVNNHHQGWQQSQAWQDRAVGSGNTDSHRSPNYQQRSPGQGQQTTDQNARGYGNRSQRQGPGYGHGSNGYCR